MKSLHVEMLMGHNTGLARNYYRPNEKDLVEEYLKAINDLSIFEKMSPLGSEDLESLKEDNALLKKKMTEMEESQKKADRKLEELTAVLKEIKSRN